MRRAVALALLVLLAAVPAMAQASAGTSNPTTPGSPGGTMPASGAATGTQGSTPGSGQPANSVPGVQQSGPSGSSATASLDQIPAGMEIRATLDTPLSTRTSKPGDRFTATISQPALGSNGSVVIPAGARVEGEVADPDENKVLAAVRDKGKLSLRLRDIVLPAGQTLPLSATLISVNDTNGRSTKKTDEESARNRNATVGMGIGAAARPVFGPPLRGLAIGAMAGGGYVIANKSKEVNLPAQTGMVIRLDQQVSSTNVPQ